MPSPLMQSRAAEEGGECQGGDEGEGVLQRPGGLRNQREVCGWGGGGKG